MSESEKLTVGEMIKWLQQFDDSEQLVRWDSEYYSYGKFVPVMTSDIGINSTLIQAHNSVDLEPGKYYPSIFTTFI